MTDVKMKVTFVIPKHCKDENDCSEDMLIAYTACENHRGGGLQAHWAHENSITFDQPFTNSDIFVLSEFEGDLYEKLKATKCVLVGPRCLSCSLAEGSSIPTKGHPVYTIAMRGLIVSLTGFSKELKTSLKQKIEWMGGIFSAVLSSETTHLIANNVFSNKYMKAAERGIPVMKKTWVDAVWEASLKLDINGSSSEFDSHRLPPFANLQITTSGLNSQDKNLVMKLVNANGGDFSRVFLSQTTNVIVLTKESTSSAKYKAAIEFGKVCVTPDWVTDSAALGFALPVSRYKVTSTTTSSPVRDRPIPDMSSNLTRITRDGKPTNFVEESKMAESMMLSGTSKVQRNSKKDSVVDEIQRAFEAFDVASIKKAGPIFDGFCIWVSGLDGMPRDRAWACVSKAGGTRYDGPNARVTHAVSWGPAASAAAASLPFVPVLSPLWLIRSVEAGRVLDEAEFVINTEPATPRKSSQPPLAATCPMRIRTLQLLLPPRDTTAREEPQRDHIVDHYLSQHLSQAAEANNKTPEPVEKQPPKNYEDTAVTVLEFTQSDNIFKDLVFEVQGLEDEFICDIGAEIRAEGGMLAAAGAGGTHVLVPLDFDTSQLVTESAETVTVIWVKDCLSRQELTPIEYYHRPVHIKSPNANPLHGVVASLGTYRGVERAFLDELAKLCGATMQQRFCRRSNNSALASTHLICPEPRGAKYSAARKWAVPVVRASWLLACAQTGLRVDESEHAVEQEEGDSTSTNQSNLVNPPPTPEPKKATLETKKTTPEPERTIETEKSSEHEKIAFQPEKRSLQPEKRSEPEKRPPMPEKKPHTRSKTPESLPHENLDAKRSEPQKRPPMPEKKPDTRSKTPESLPHENLDANIVTDVEQMLPPGVAPNASPRQTKKKFKKINIKSELFEGMSPASRFITMRRMGMFSDHEDSSKENTPKKTSSDEDAYLHEAAGIQTPPFEEVLSSPNLQWFSPSTRSILQAIRRGEMPEEPIKTPDNPFDKKILTPDSGFGAVLRPGLKCMSPNGRKLLWEFINELPTNEPRRWASDLETPPSKIAQLTENQCAGGARLPDRESSTPRTSLIPPSVVLTPVPSAVPTPVPSAVPIEVDEQLQRLNVVLTGRRTPRRACRAAPVAPGKPPVDKKILTPDSDFGAVLRPGLKCMSPNGCKLLWEFINELPTNEPRRWASDLETPPSKIAQLTENQCAGGARLPDGESSTPRTSLVPPSVVLTPVPSAVPTPVPSAVPIEVDEQLQRLNVVLTGRGTPRRACRAAPVAPGKPPVDKKILTPDSDFGAVLRPGLKCMSPNGCKLLWEFINELPTNEPRRWASDLETPPSKIAQLTENQCAGGARLPDGESSTPRTSLIPPSVVLTPVPSAVPTPVPSAVPIEVDEQLQRLNVVLTGRRTPRRACRGAPVAPGKPPVDKKILTPDSDFGAVLRPGLKCMSPNGRKLLWEFINELPTNEPRRWASDLETPPSKIAQLTENQCAGGARLPDGESSTPRTSLIPPSVVLTPVPSAVPTPVPSAVPIEVDEQLQRLNVVLTGRRTPRRACRAAPVAPGKPPDMKYESGPESQPNTVGWDDTTPSQKDSFESISKPQSVETEARTTINEAKKKEAIVTHASKMEVEIVKANSVMEKAVQTKEKVPVKTVRRFMLSSNVDNREETVEMILRLGGEVTALDEEDNSSPATHLLCCAPVPSQRVLNCIASGCWVLHPAYVARSTSAGLFLQEEAFEWGNPLATCLPPVSGGEEVLALAAHRWRTRRANGQPGPYAGVVALLHVPEQRWKQFARLVKNGEGIVVDEEPPYTDESINVCFTDGKRYPMKERDRVWFVSRRVPVCASILISAFLTEETRPDLNQHCLPEFKA